MKFETTAFCLRQRGHSCPRVSDEGSGSKSWWKKAQAVLGGLLQGIGCHGHPSSLFPPDCMLATCSSTVLLRALYRFAFGRNMRQLPSQRSMGFANEKQLA